MGLDLPPGSFSAHRPLFSVALWLDGHAVTVYLRGELDCATVDDLRVALSGLRMDGHRHFALNLSELGFLSAAGIGAFAEAAAECIAVGGSLILVEPSVQSRRVLALTDLDHLIV